MIIKTPLITNETINKKTNSKIYFKLENLQKTGSFKIRGAANKIGKLSNNEKSRGIVSYSSGNHAQAVAYVSKHFNIKSTIVNLILNSYQNLLTQSMPLFDHHIEHP